MKIDEDGTLKISIDFTNLLVDDFNVPMETTGVDPTKYHPS